MHTKNRISHPSNVVSSCGRREYQVILFSFSVLRIVVTCGKHGSRIAAPRVCMFCLPAVLFCCTRLVCLSAYYFARGDSLGSGVMVLLAVTVWFMLVIYRASVHVRPRPAGAQCRKQSKAKQSIAKAKAEQASSTHLEDGLSMELRAVAGLRFKPQSRGQATFHGCARTARYRGWTVDHPLSMSDVEQRGA